MNVDARVGIDEVRFLSSRYEVCKADLDEGQCLTYEIPSCPSSDHDTVRAREL